MNTTICSCNGMLTSFLHRKPDIFSKGVRLLTLDYDIAICNINGFLTFLIYILFSHIEYLYFIYRCSLMKISPPFLDFLARLYFLFFSPIFYNMIWWKAFKDLQQMILLVDLPYQWSDDPESKTNDMK